MGYCGSDVWAAVLGFKHSAPIEGMSFIFAPERRRAPQSKFPLLPAGRRPSGSGTLVQIDVAQIGLERAEALREACVRVLVGELGRDDDLLALFPVDRGRDRLRVGELEAVDQIGRASCRERVGQYV